MSLKFLGINYSIFLSTIQSNSHNFLDPMELALRVIYFCEIHVFRLFC